MIKFCLLNYDIYQLNKIVHKYQHINELKFQHDIFQQKVYKEFIYSDIFNYHMYFNNDYSLFEEMNFAELIMQSYFRN